MPTHRQTMKPSVKALGAILLATSSSCWAWGAAGHQTIAAIAAKLIQGSRAEQEVQALIGDLSLADISVWPDCAKAISPAQGYKYLNEGKYKDCGIFETPEREAEMADFVRRNDQNCQPKPGEEICHKQYHYSDIAIQRSTYSLGSAGTREDDIVGAVAAATHVLMGEPAPAPFNIKDKREALLLLVHYVGDLHQPLHVGAVYLSRKGSRMDPDMGTYDPSTATRGGNSIQIRSANMHSLWDDIPRTLTAPRIDDLWLAHAKAVHSTPGDIYTWPAQWATGTLEEAQAAFTGVKFGAFQGKSWPGALPAGYSPTMSEIKKTQLTEGGAHLAELLQAIWP